MESNQSGVNDEELNRMIATLKQQRAAGAADGVAPAGQKVVQPPVQPQVNQPVVQPPADGAGVNGIPTTPEIRPIDQGQSAEYAPGATATEANNEQPSAAEIAAAEDLNNIKMQAITELRPLVDKLDLAPADKFDTLLLLIRTTDDSSLIPAAHDAAKSIPDEARRAQALLDIIKEIDFFGRK